MASPRRAFTVVDRTTIALRLRDGWGVRMIARSLGRSAGTVSNEVNRNGGAATYEAVLAEDRAVAKRKTTGRKARMMRDGAVFIEATRLLGLGWSPEQISGRRKREDVGMQQVSGLRVSHEAIYAAIYSLPRGELRRELIGCLRHAKPARGRKPKGGELRGKLVGMTNIKDRPEEIEGRLVPGTGRATLSSVPGARARSARWSNGRPASSFWCTCRHARLMWRPARSRAR